LDGRGRSTVLYASKIFVSSAVECLARIAHGDEHVSNLVSARSVTTSPASDELDGIPRRFGHDLQDPIAVSDHLDTIDRHICTKLQRLSEPSVGDSHSFEQDRLDFSRLFQSTPAGLD